MMQKLLSKKKSKYGLLLLLCLVSLYVIHYYGVNRVFSGLGTNVARAVLWLVLALSITLFFPKPRPEAKPRQRKIFSLAGFLYALLGAGALFATGFLDGFGKSPYDHSFPGIMINILHFVPMLIGVEVARFWFINGLFKKKPTLGVIVISFFFTLLAFSPQRFMSLQTGLDRATFAGNLFLPALTENMLASYLALFGGVMPALIYRGTLLAIEWFSPVLPDPGLILKAIVGTFVPVFCIVFLNSLYQREVLRIRRKDKESGIGWLVASIASVLVIWFAIGVFSVFPNVIISGSMSPEIEVGDVVLIQRMHPTEIELGDIVIYNAGNVRITHRVIEIKEDARGLPLFITQGDANARPDSSPVEAEQVLGKVINIVPRIGRITIWLRSAG